MKISYLQRENKPILAYAYSPPNKQGAKLPLVLFCGGYRSNMNGTKAQYLEQQCQMRDQAYIRFDYSGHGSSEGTFEDGCIGSWLGDALDIFDHAQTLSPGPTIIIGSSMGGWIALLLAQKRKNQVSGLIGISTAPDFTEEMFHRRLTPAQQQTLMDDGLVALPNNYSDEPYLFTKDFYEEAKIHLLLTRPQTTHCPMRLIHSLKDSDVPWQIAKKIEKNYGGETVDMLLIEDGDHRLSRPEDLALIDRELQSLSLIKTV